MLPLTTHLKARTCPTDNFLFMYQINSTSSKQPFHPVQTRQGAVVGAALPSSSTACSRGRTAARASPTRLFSQLCVPVGSRV